MYFRDVICRFLESAEKKKKIQRVHVELVESRSYRGHLSSGRNGLRKNAISSISDHVFVHYFVNLNCPLETRDFRQTRGLYAVLTRYIFREISFHFVACIQFVKEGIRFCFKP